MATAQWIDAVDARKADAHGRALVRLTAHKTAYGRFSGGERGGRERGPVGKLLRVPRAVTREPA